MKIKKVEMQRKLVHMVFGVLTVLLIKFGLIGATHIFFLVIFSIIISFLIKRYRMPLIHFLMANLERDENIKSFPAKGLIFYLIGIFLVLSFFPLDIAMSSILVLAFADSIGHLFGIRFGKIPHPFVSKKSVE